MHSDIMDVHILKDEDVHILDLGTYKDAGLHSKGKLK